MRKVDIRAYKNSLRDKAKAMRRGMDPVKKAEMDRQITERICSLYQYREAETLLCYVSKPIEVDTIPLLRRALADGKRVACPRCVEGTKQMEFYLIRSLDDLEKRTFGVPEPRVPGCELLTDFSRSLCIVPALMYDLKGYRLGYGGGYYDRFLARYDGYKVGITYRRNILRFLHYGRFDIPVDMIVTESFFRLTDRSKVPSRS
ncbi:MAG: 5-formyltetrahydrofolate cyclo-ligase [Clostridiales bacterium]|nr:5-formyltetrahydrofolate cyclo-ligase [Clostridiales bacterium]